MKREIGIFRPHHYDTLQAAVEDGADYILASDVALDDIQEILDIAGECLGERNNLKAVLLEGENKMDNDNRAPKFCIGQQIIQKEKVNDNIFGNRALTFNQGKVEQIVDNGKTYYYKTSSYSGDEDLFIPVDDIKDYAINILTEKIKWVIGQ